MMMKVFGFQLDIDAVDDAEEVTADSTAEMPRIANSDDDGDGPELELFRQVFTNHKCLSNILIF